MKTEWLEKKKEIQSATYERLINHLNKRNDVQNIDLMNLAGFCRNCLSKWLYEESENIGIKISKEESEMQVYGMSKTAWKEKYQK